jgi:hypothetical protein
MNDNTTLRMMIATAALAAVAALFAGGANAKMLDEGGSGGGASAVPATQPPTIPYLSHGIGVDASQFSGQASPKPTGVHAALARDREPAASSTAERQTIPYLSHGIGVDESQFSGQAWGGQASLGLTGDSAQTRVDGGSQVADDRLDPAIRTAIATHASDSAVTVERQTIPYLSHGIGVDAAQFSGQASLGLTGDSPLTRVSAPEPEGLTGDSPLTRYPGTVSLPATSGGSDTDWTWFGVGAGMAALLAAGLAGVLLSTRHRNRVALP